MTSHPKQKWLILLSVACGTFMATLDASIVNVALPSITTSLHTGLSHSRWVVIAYLFGITGLLLFFGKLADLINRKVIFQLGFFTFTLGSLLCGLAHNIQQLIWFRALQGCGAAMLMANGPAIITASFPGNERGKALGILSMAVSIGLALGPTIGGLLVRYFSWPSIFWVNCPFGIIGLYLVHRFVPPSLGMPVSDKKAFEAFNREQQLPWYVRMQLYLNRSLELDWVGSFLWMGIQFGFVLAIDRENLIGFSGPAQRILSFGSVGLLALFLIWEWSVREPILDLTLFKSRLFLTANLSSLFNFVAISAITLLMPFYLQNVRGLPPDRLGLVMTAIPLTTLCVAPISGRLSDLYGSRILSTIGMLILCGGMALFSLPWNGLLSANISTVILYLVLMGIGIGLFQSPNSNAIMGDVSNKHLGVASALLATVRNFGLVIGTALGSALLMFYYRSQSLHVQSGVPVPTAPENFVTALRYTYLTLACICSIAIITSLMSYKPKYRKV